MFILFLYYYLHLLIRYIHYQTKTYIVRKLEFFVEVVTRIKHDVYLHDLCEKVKSDYDYVSTNVRLFSKKGRVLAEIDLLAVKNGSCAIFEVKCSYRITKAKKQLQRIKRLMPHVTNMYFFCGASGLLKEVEME